MNLLTQELVLFGHDWTSNSDLAKAPLCENSISQKLSFEMLGFPTSTRHEKKCSVTHGIMGHLDPKQPPVKRKPFAAILNHSFVHKVDRNPAYEILSNNSAYRRNSFCLKSYMRSLKAIFLPRSKPQSTVESSSPCKHFWKGTFSMSLSRGVRRFLFQVVIFNIIVTDECGR